MGKLILIDGNAILHRAYHALPPLTTRSGEPVNAVYGLVSMLLKIVTDLKPTHIAVAFDRKEKTFRQQKFASYQAHRPEMDEDLSGQFEKAKRVLSAMNIPIFDKAGYEADDVIGTIAKHVTRNTKHKNAFGEVVIVTGDRDILQLVNDKEKIKVYMPVKGLSEGQLMDETAVEEKMGVTPSQIIDYKALVGDPSDNYPGVNGIGPKTATYLIESYGSLENIYRNLKKVNTKVAEKLEKNKENAQLSYMLATIVNNVDIDFDLTKCGQWVLGNKKTLDLFSEYGFRTLTERLKKVGKELDEQKQMTLL